MSLSHLRVVLAALTMSGLMSACAQFGALKDPPRVTLVNLKPLQTQLLEQRFTATLRIQNPSTVPLPVRGMDYEITLNDRRFATGVSDQVFTVPPFGEETVEVAVSSSLVRILEQLLALERSKTLKFNYGISGGLSVQGAFTKIPFSFEDQLDLSGLRKPATDEAI